VPQGSTVVVLDLPDHLGPAPLWPSWGLQGALRHWYNDRTLVVADRFTPYARHFVPGTGGAPQHYDQLLLFTYRHQVLERKASLIIEAEAATPVTVQLAPGFPGGALPVRSGLLTPAS
jgi:hypothetical protein